jgi:hypothetical protein
MSVTAFWGFSYTYFMPVLAGAYPEVSPAVHLHGWSFFLWFLLLPLQSLLMTTGRRRAHMTLGGTSVALAVVMAFTGILVASVRIEQGLFATEPDELTAFWKGFGQLIMYNMILFVGFYGTAIARRDRPDVHKRMMVLASASVLPAAIFRIIVALTGRLLARNAGMGDARRVLPPGRVHRCRHGARPRRQGGHPPRVSRWPAGPPARAWAGPHHGRYGGG